MASSYFASLSSLGTISRSPLPIKKGTTRPPLLGRLSNRASTCNAVSLLSKSSQYRAQSSAALLDNLRLSGLLCTCQAYLPAPLYGVSYVNPSSSSKQHH